ncbi:hypothetical protein APH_1092 [Anaplasma phagocytophilum str. HZ]|uniref:Uncharacterized protein n=1 Tax=Anaplasma phagocytophilum (strain HZ) TaxID=212042 RepID=Q2GJ11_ANAPZ|nr:hypothetical protein APH_1055 [Anaplasma phagocytophilum str. HZ]ABD44407.1 hypothetical protein APH_1092 [Anaplasma phagocytophilum str. HZ]
MSCAVGMFEVSRDFGEAIALCKAIDLQLIV